MRLNVAAPYVRPITHEGGPAARITALQSLRRSLLACLLWEDEFYEDGRTIASRIIDQAMDPKVHFGDVARLAVEARSEYHLRHAPLLLLTALIAKGSALGAGSTVARTIRDTIQRPDELAELLAIYWKDGKRPLAAQLKRGLALAFQKFTAYQLAKYNRDGAIKLRDVLFLCHAKPTDEAQAAIWKQLVEGTLAAPDTWEVALSGGANKRETFTRLLTEGTLGYLALLRNLRGMAEAGVDDGLIREAILARKGAERVLPFRYVAAARACPRFEPVLDEALSMAIDGMKPLTGRTIVLVDVSGSMDEKLSAKSDLTRLDAAATLASMVPGDVRVFTFSHQVVEVPPRRGMAGVDAIHKSQSHQGTWLQRAMLEVMRERHDRLIIVTDEQSQDGIATPVMPTYLINVASNKNGVGYGNGFVHLTGFSENTLRYIEAYEATGTS